MIDSHSIWITVFEFVKQKKKSKSPSSFSDGQEGSNPTMYGNNHNRTVQADELARMSAENDSLLLFTDPASILDRKERTADQRHIVKLCGAQSDRSRSRNYSTPVRMISVLRSELGLRSAQAPKFKGQRGDQSLCLEAKDTKTRRSSQQRKPRT